MFEKTTNQLDHKNDQLFTQQHADSLPAEKMTLKQEVSYWIKDEVKKAGSDWNNALKSAHNTLYGNMSEALFRGVFTSRLTGKLVELKEECGDDTELFNQRQRDLASKIGIISSAPVFDEVKAEVSKKFIDDPSTKNSDSESLNQLIDLALQSEKAAHNLRLENEQLNNKSMVIPKEATSYQLYKDQLETASEPRRPTIIDRLRELPERAKTKVAFAISAAMIAVSAWGFDSYIRNDAPDLSNNHPVVSHKKSVEANNSVYIKPSNLTEDTINSSEALDNLGPIKSPEAKDVQIPENLSSSVEEKLNIEADNWLVETSSGQFDVRDNFDLILPQDVVKNIGIKGESTIPIQVFPQDAAVLDPAIQSVMSEPKQYPNAADTYKAYAEDLYVVGIHSGQYLLEKPLGSIEGVDNYPLNFLPAEWATSNTYKLEGQYLYLKQNGVLHKFRISNIHIEDTKLDTYAIPEDPSNTVQYVLPFNPNNQTQIVITTCFSRNLLTGEFEKQLHIELAPSDDLDDEEMASTK